MLKLNKELGLTPTQFSAYWGITDPKRKDDFLAKLKACLPVAEKLGVKKLCVVAGEVTPNMSAGGSGQGRDRRPEGRR